MKTIKKFSVLLCVALFSMMSLQKANADVLIPFDYISGPTGVPVNEDVTMYTYVPQYALDYPGNSGRTVVDYECTVFFDGSQNGQPLSDYADFSFVSEPGVGCGFIATTKNRFSPANIGHTFKWEIKLFFSDGTWGSVSYYNIPFVYAE